MPEDIPRSPVTAPKGTSAEAKITLDEVAQMVGLSKATVSKAINGRRDVSVATKLKVRQAIDELGYRHPSSLGSRTYPHIAMVIDSFTTMYTPQFLQGATQQALEKGVSLSLSSTDIDAPVEAPVVPPSTAWLRLIAAQGYLGVILLTSKISEEMFSTCNRLGLAMISVDSRSDLPEGVPSIGATNWNGGLDATQHLLELGHRRIAIVNGPPHSIPSIERYQGYVSAHQMAGIPIDSRFVTGGDFHFDSGLESATRLLALPRDERPTAFFAGCDWSALGVIEAVRSADLRVPEDVSVIGFDDTLLATSSAPPLTAIRQPLSDMGALAVRQILSMHQGERQTGAIKLQTSLVVRESTGPAPA